jgi:uncharacterized protein (TIGR02145 family)
MRTRLFFIQATLIGFMLSGIQAQNQMLVRAFASSDHSEGSFSWFLDNENLSGSQLTIQVTDSRTGANISGCKIDLSFYTKFNPELKVNIPQQDIIEIKKGLYVMRGSGELFNAVMNKAGQIKTDISVHKVNYKTVTFSATFQNQDYLTGQILPLDNIWFWAPRYLSVEENDPTAYCKTKTGMYYWVMVDYIKNSSSDWLLLPVEHATHKVPDNWQVYEQTARTLTVGKYIESFNPDQLSKLDLDLKKMQKLIPLIKSSGSAIDLLTPVLTRLIRVALADPSAIPEMKHFFADQIAQFILDEATDPLTYSEGFFLAESIAKIEYIRDTIQHLTKLLDSQKKNKKPLMPVFAEMAYRQYNYIWVNSTMVADFTQNDLTGKNVWNRMLEAEIKALIRSKLPYQTKLIELAHHIETKEKNLMNALKKSEEITSALYYQYERHWDKKGDAKWLFQQLGGAVLKKDIKQPLPPVENFIQKISNNTFILEFDKPLADNVNYVLKYNSEPITNDNWNASYYVMIPSNLPESEGKIVFESAGKSEEKQNLYFAIKYYDETGRSSELAVAAKQTDIKPEKKQQEEIYASGNKPKADFDASTNSGSAPLTVKYIDKSTNNPTSWIWNFGDGSTSRLQNPEHTYQNAGKYTVRLTARNKNGSDVSIKTNYVTVTAGSGKGQPCPGTPTVTDIDGNVYNTVLIGDQCWMKENLNTTRDANGKKISRYCYDNNADYCNWYGGLYTWQTVINGQKSRYGNPNSIQGICPEGWHVPDILDWDQLKNHLADQGYSNSYDSKNPPANTLKSCRQENSPKGGDCNTLEHPRWESDDIHYGSDIFGFSALPSGCYNNGSYIGLGYYGAWWLNSFSSSFQTISFDFIISGSDFIYYGEVYVYEDIRISLRCLKN